MVFPASVTDPNENLGHQDSDELPLLAKPCTCHRSLLRELSAILKTQLGEDNRKLAPGLLHSAFALLILF